MTTTRGIGAKPTSKREATVARAQMVAASRHDRCDSYDLQAGQSDVSGDNLAYCGNCGQLLLRWGGGE